LNRTGFSFSSEAADGRPRAVLVDIDTQGDPKAVDESLDELEGLLDTAGGVAAARMVQSREAPESATFIGEGKVDKLAETLKNLDCPMAVFNSELTPSQIRNLEERTGAQILDRSMLILDIFAMRAKSGEGKLQVALAQLQYMLPRLTAKYEALSRLGGGIGTRGPGESKLETDRRYIRQRISSLKKDIAEIKKNREVQRAARIRSRIPVVSVVGYTNAGKSTLFNRLTGAGVLEEDKLFATLDPTARRVKFDQGELIFIDTVGLIRRLPHHLVDAFRSTLEEMVHADIILHVIDVSSPVWESNRDVALELLRDIGAGQDNIITVYNKCDLAGSAFAGREAGGVCISAKDGRGVGEMVDAIFGKLASLRRRVLIEIPYSDMQIMDLLHRRADIIDSAYTEAGMRLTAVVDEEIYGRVKKYIAARGD